MQRGTGIKSWAISLRKYLLSNFPSLISSYYRFLWKPKEGKLEHLIDEFSKNRNEVFFIQVGSNDGFQHDPLCKFIKRDGWKGILLEPQTKAFQTLREIYRNDKVVAVNKALDREDGQRKLFKLNFSDERWASGLCSFDRSHLENMITNGHVARKSKDERIVGSGNFDEYIGYDYVDCISFPTLFQNHAVSKVDLLHIDTEGHDCVILQHFDFNTYHPNIVIFESSHLSPDEYHRCEQYLGGFGYRLSNYGADTVALITV